MPFRRTVCPSIMALSASSTPSSSAACTAPTNNADTASALKTIFDARAAERGARRPRGMALHVDGDRVHGDVRRRRLDMHGEGGRIAAEALRSDAEHVYRVAEVPLELGALRVLAGRATRPPRRHLGEMLARRARAAAADRFLQLQTIHLDAAADPYVVHRDARVLAQEVVGALGDGDIADHRAEHALRSGVGLPRRERLEAALHVRRQLFQRPDVELLRRLLDRFQIDLHFTSILRSFTTFAQSRLSALIALANSSGLLPTGERPCTYRRPRKSLASSAFLVSSYTLRTISLGVPVGATMPNQPSFSKPASVRPIGGTPGSCGTSLLLVTPSARTRPDWMCGSVAAWVVRVDDVSPLARPPSAGPSPL